MAREFCLLDMGVHRWADGVKVATLSPHFPLFFLHNRGSNLLHMKQVEMR